MKIRTHPRLVVIGRWNTAILRPEWFSKVVPEIISPGQKIEIEFSLDVGSIRFTLDQVVKIQPTPLRLDLFVDTEAEDACNEEYCIKVMNMATKIVETLPHTPITAVGHNVAYDLTEKEAIKNMPDSELEKFNSVYEAMFPSASLNTHRLRHSIDFSEYILNLTSEVGHDQAFVDFNYHYAVSDLESIKNAISQFNTNIQASKNIFENLIRNE